MSAMQPSLSYRSLFAVPGFARLVASALLARTANMMTALLIVLFVLDRYHSPQLSGVVVLFSVVPGLVLSPLAGALLDRGARTRLIGLDYGAGAAAMLLVVLLARSGVLPPWLLIVVVAVGSLTAPLSNSGTRSLFPVIVPRAMWDRANAVDSGAYVVATVVGPGLGGLIVALVGPSTALLVPAGIWAGAALLLVGLHVPRSRTESSGSILRDAWDGLAYVLRNRGLRALAVTLSVFNMGFGFITVGLPVMVLTRLHGTSVQVGILFAVMGGAGIVAGLLAGRLDSEGREREFMLAGCAGSVAGMLLLAFSGSLLLAAVAMAILGLANGPLDIGLFSLRQRVTDRAWLGRAFAVSMSLNFLGYPLGSAISGPVVARSVTATFLVATVVVALSGLAPLLMLPSRRADQTVSARDRELTHSA
jgi:predicted MFS family arabinose efflux permease